MFKVLLRAKKGFPYPDYNGLFKQTTEYHRRSDLGCSIIIPDCGSAFLDMHSTFEWQTKGKVSIASRNDVASTVTCTGPTDLSVFASTLLLSLALYGECPRRQ